MAAQGAVTKNYAQTSYVFVRVLGKGAFGEAILYRKTDVSESNFPVKHIDRRCFYLSIENSKIWGNRKVM